MGIFSHEEGTILAQATSIVTDCLGDGQDVCLGEGSVQRCATVSARAEADELIGVAQIGATLEILPFEPGGVDQHLFRCRLTREWGDRHVGLPFFQTRCRRAIRTGTGRPGELVDAADGSAGRMLFPWKHPIRRRKRRPVAVLSVMRVMEQIALFDEPQPSTFLRVGTSSSGYSTMSDVTPGIAHIQVCDTISILPRNGQATAVPRVRREWPTTMQRIDSPGLIAICLLESTRRARYKGCL